MWVVYLTERRGFTLGQVTFLDVPFWMSIIALQVPAAAIADRWGRKQLKGIKGRQRLYEVVW